MPKAARICPALLALLIVGHVAANVAWWQQSTGPEFADQASYLLLSERMHGGWQHKGAAGFADAFINLDRSRAPLVPALYAGTYALAGNERGSARLVNVAALVVLCLSVYGIGRRLAGPWCGLASAWITMILPMMFGLSRQLLVEFPLAAAAAAVVYFCMASDGFRRYGAAVLLGIALGTGLMIKVTFPVFIFGPIWAALFGGIFMSRETVHERVAPRRTVLSIVIVILVAGVIAGPWYIYNAKEWTGYLNENVSGHFGGIFGGSNEDYLLAQAGLSLFYLLVPTALILIVIRLLFGGASAGKPAAIADAMERRRALLILGTWLLLPLLAGLYATVKEPRVIAPAFPALGILAAYLFVRLTARRAAFVPGALLLSLLVPFWGVSFGAPLHIPREGLGGLTYAKTYQPRSTADWSFLTVADGGLLKYFLGKWRSGNYVCGPFSDDWKSDEIVSIIDGRVPGWFVEEGKTVKVVVVTEHPCLQAAWFSYIEWRRDLARGLDAALVDFDGMPSLDSEATFTQFVEKIILAHFVIVKDSGWQGFERSTAWFDRLMSQVRGSGLLTEVKMDHDIVLPDGSKVIIYRPSPSVRSITSEPGPEREPGTP